jgi:hypothetical protein
MLRAIFFLECDYCHDSYSSIHSLKGITDHAWCYVGANLMESAFDDGWLHCLEEDTGNYRLMCCDCEERLTFETKLAVVSEIEVAF